jgi:hypothetical protein
MKKLYLGFISQRGVSRIIPALASWTATVVSYTVINLLNNIFISDKLKNTEKYIYNSIIAYKRHNNVEHKK